MRRRSLLPALVVALGLLGGACAGDGDLGGPTLGGTPAAVIGDEVVSNADLRDEVERWASNPAMLQAIGITDLGQEGRRSSDLVAFVLSHRVVSEQARLMLADARQRAEGGLDLAEQGIDGEVLSEPRDQEIEAILGQLDQQFTSPEGGSVFQVFEEGFRRTLARDLAYQDRLQTIAQLGIEAPHVAVNPRFGQAEVLQGGIVQVVAPTGPLPSLGA